MGNPIQVRIGDEGIAGSVLRPGGIVVIEGQRFSARSHGELIEEGTVILITGGDNHGFTVRVAESVEVRESLPQFGEPAFSDFGSSKKAQALKNQEEMRRWLVARQRTIRRIGPIVGVLFAALMMGFLWEDFFSTKPMIQAAGVTTGLLGLGAIIGFLLLKFIDDFLRDIDFVLYRFSLPTLCLLFLGFCVGAVWGIPHFGLPTGLLCGLGGGLLLGLPLPIFVAFVAVGGNSEGTITEPSQPQTK